MQIHRGIFPMGLCIASFSFGMTTCTSSGTGLRVQKFLRRIFLHAKGSALACNYNVPRRADRQGNIDSNPLWQPGLRKCKCQVLIASRFLYNWFPMFHLALPCTGQSHRIISPELCVRSSPSMSRESLPNRVFILSFLLAFVFFASFASAQDPQSDSSSQSGSASPQPQDKETDPLKRPLTEKQRKENEKRFKQEVSSSFKKWLNEDVAYIITDEERAAFKQLSNDEERDNFIEAFWQRRD